MKLRRLTEQVSDDFIPFMGEEIYDTETDELYVGDGYKTVANLDAFPSTLTSFKVLGTSAIASAGLTGDISKLGIGLPPSGTTELFFAGIEVPSTWRSYRIQGIFRATSTGNCRVTYDIYSENGGSLFTTAGITLSVSSGPTGTTTNIGSSSYTQNGVIAIKLVRLGDNGADTNTGSMFVNYLLFTKLS